MGPLGLTWPDVCQPRTVETPDDEVLSLKHKLTSAFVAMFDYFCLGSSFVLFSRRFLLEYIDFSLPLIPQ